jgi:hypothetical protein
MFTSNYRCIFKVKEKFDNHFIVRRNVIFERAKFNKRKQEDSENVENFVTSLYTLSEHCCLSLWFLVFVCTASTVESHRSFLTKDCCFLTDSDWRAIYVPFLSVRSGSSCIFVNFLIYSMGPEADDIFASFELNDENKKKYAKVKEWFDNHFIVRRNVIFERAKFNYLLLSWVLGLDRAAF